MPSLRATTFSRDANGRTVYPQFDTENGPLDVSIPMKGGMKLNGMFSNVFLGEWTRKASNGQYKTLWVAVKDMRAVDSETEEDAKEAIETLLWREANILCRLKHDNILPFYGLCYMDGPGEGPLCLVTPWVHDSMTLLKFLAFYPTANRHALMSDVTAALSYLHSSHTGPTATGPGVHVIHGDIHAKNVLITYSQDSSGNCLEDTCRAMLCDFGLSKVVAEIPGIQASYSFPIGIRHGLCLAPELLLDQDRVQTVRTKASDVFAYGYLIHKAYSTPLENDRGEPVPKDPMDNLRSDAQRTRIVDGIRHARPPRADCTDNMWLLMQRCWAQDPRARPTMSEVEAALPSCAAHAWRPGTVLVMRPKPSRARR